MKAVYELDPVGKEGCLERETRLGAEADLASGRRTAYAKTWQEGSKSPIKSVMRWV